MCCVVVLLFLYRIDFAAQLLLLHENTRSSLSVQVSHIGKYKGAPKERLSFLDRKVRYKNEKVDCFECCYYQ